MKNAWFEYDKQTMNNKNLFELGELVACASRERESFIASFEAFFFLNSSQSIITENLCTSFESLALLFNSS